MPLKLIIDVTTLRQISRDVGLVLDSVLDRCGNEIYDRIHALARQTLGTTREPYLEALKPPRRTRTKVIVELDGDLAEMVEKGTSSFNQREAFLNSPKAKEDANGRRYIDIPAHYSDPRLGSTHRTRDAYPASLRAAAARLGPGERMKSGPFFSRKGTTIYSPYRQSPLRVASAEYHQGGSGAITLEAFRRIGEDTELADHPGFSGVKFFEIVTDEADDFVPEIVFEELVDAGHYEWTDV